jgi:hypothetical protein
MQVNPLGFTHTMLTRVKEKTNKEWVGKMSNPRKVLNTYIEARGKNKKLCR